MQKIKHPEQYEIVKFDGVNVSGVYIGSFDRLVRTDLVWKKNKRRSEVTGMKVYSLTLDEIRKQLCEKDYLITVFVNSPLHGEILQWGNYGNEWWQIGETCGYC